MALTGPNSSVYNSRGPITTRMVTVAAGQTIHYGELVMIGSDGLGYACAALASNRGIVGICTTPGSTAAGGRIEVASGEFRLPATSGAQNMVQTEVFGQANSTVGATAANLPIAGIVTEFESASWLWLRVGPDARI